MIQLSRDFKMISDLWEDLSDDERRAVNRKLALIARDLGH
jgi:ribonucleotide reductase beta subunit family protein with ferritin-like domain